MHGGGTYRRPKDSNAVVGVRDRATGKALEGADRLTDVLYTVSEKKSLHYFLNNFNKFKFTFIIFGILYHNDTRY